MPEEYNGFPSSGYPYQTTPTPQGYGSPPPSYGGQGTPPPSTAPYYPYPKAPTSGTTPPPSTGYSNTTSGGVPGPTPLITTPPVTGALPLPAVEQSYIENILRLNKDKEVTVYMTFEHGGGNESKVFTGNIEAAGRDHLILKENASGTRYLLPLIYLDYVVFQGKVNYAYPYRR